VTALDVSELHSKTTAAKWPRVQGTQEKIAVTAKVLGANVGFDV